MSEFRVTYWRDLPSLVVARDGEHVTKSPLAPRFQEAIDEAAMRLGDTGSDDYLAGLDPRGVDRQGRRHARGRGRGRGGLEEAWPQEKLTEYLDSLGPEAQG